MEVLDYFQERDYLESQERSAIGSDEYPFAALKQLIDFARSHLSAMDN